MKKILCSALVCFVAFSATFAQTKNSANSKTEQEVLVAVDSVLQALVKRDAAVLEQALTADFYTVYDNGQVGDRKLLIDSFQVTTSGWDAFERLKSTVKFAGNGAVALCETKAKRHSPAGIHDLHWQTTVALVKEGGQWRVAAAHFTLIKPPAPRAAQ